MNQTVKLKQSKDFDKYDCGSGPRPPVPGEESRSTKMTAEDVTCNSTLNLNRSPNLDSPTTADLIIRISNWQKDFFYILDDQDGIKLLFKYVEEDAGKDSIDYARLKFYFACRGLKTQSEDDNQRRLISAIHGILKKQDEIHVTPELRNTIRQIAKKEIPPNPNIFDELQKEVEITIGTKIYPSFLLSPVFIEFAEQAKQQRTSSSVDGRASVSNANIADGTTVYDNFSSASTVELLPLAGAANLQTLHEDVELKLNEGAHPSKSTSGRPMPKLTSDLLLATQKRRLEVRPQGAHGYTYRVPFNSSYNPVSRVDSERQSCSSASLTDSEVNSKDGKPYIHRKPTAAEDYQRCYVNPAIASHSTILKPLSQGLKERVEPISKSRMEQASLALDKNQEYFLMRLNEIARERENEERQEQFNRALKDRLTSPQFKTQPKMFPETLLKTSIIEDDDQSILDQHVSRVFSPHLSPGTASPRQLQRHQQHRNNEMSTSMPDFVPQAMRHSKSIPEHASSEMAVATTRKLAYKWPSANIDSGISLYSADLPYKPKEMRSVDQLSESTLRKTKDESRRLRKQMPVQQQLSHSVNTMPTTSSHHTNSLPRLYEPTEEYTYVVYTFGDEKIPYRTKIPGRRITLKHFKDHLPKKGSFRYFFTTNSDDPDNPIIQEEIINDMDVLPLYEGKIMGTIKPE